VVRGFGLGCDGVGAGHGGVEGEGLAVGFDDEGVGDVGDDAVSGGEADIPVGDGLGEGEGELVGGELAVGVEPEVVDGGGFVGGVGLRRPVDGGKDGERVGAAEVYPEEAGGGAEAGDAAVDDDVTVLFGGDGSVAGEEEGDDLREGRWGGGGSPGGLGLREGGGEEGLEAGVEAEVVGAAEGEGLGELPEVLEVVGGWGGALAGGGWRGRLADQVVGAVDLGIRRRGGEEESGGEMNVVAHKAGSRTS
jgi:hypothetical protein